MTRPTSCRYSLRDLAAARDDFLRRFPSFGSTAELDELRAREYARLDRLGQAYLDYTGGALYAASQLERHHAVLAASVLGNPHSHSPASMASTALVERARHALRRFFNAAADEYEAIFTANATGALRLVGEAYPFAPGGVYLLSYDNHNSVNGIREFAHRKGATVVYVPVTKDDLRLDADHLFGVLGRVRPEGAHLFAYPAQSNFSGVQHPLEWVARAQDLGWDVVLDCAAFVPTNRLDLRAVKPDFVPLSLYKLFGYPTGVGVLFARRDSLAKLQRPWFAGGTITVASVQEQEWYRLTPGAAGFEDGTLDYLGLPAVPIGIEHLEAIGIEVIHRRVQALTAWLLEEMHELRHENGVPKVRVFGPQDMTARGGVIALHLLDPRGHPYDVDAIEAAAGSVGISLRTGCFCNPGDGEVAHEISHADMELCFDGEHPVVSLADCRRVIEDATGKVPNTIRVSLGLASTFADVYRFMAFAAAYGDPAV